MPFSPRCRRAAGCGWGLQKKQCNRLRESATIAVSSDTLSVVRTQPMKAPGTFGGNEADFQSVIDLITSTVAARDMGHRGGQGSIMPFPNGVYVDPQGVLKKANQGRSHRHAGHAAQRGGYAAGIGRCSKEFRAAKSARSCSRSGRSNCLPGKELAPTEEMRFLGGLQRIQYVLLYPESATWCWPVRLAAGIRTRGQAGRKRCDGPVLQLDDLVVLLRHYCVPKTPFGCSITPTRLAFGWQEFEGMERDPIKPGRLVHG